MKLFDLGKISKKPDQMMFYLGGPGGTGKSAVLKAFTSYLENLGLRHKLRIGAHTGTAAKNVGGSTLHTLLALPMTNKAGKDKPQQTSEQTQKDFETCEIFFTDEISMVGCGQLSQISSTMQKLTGKTLLPFGGVHMIFAGDFYQLLPNDPLFKKPQPTRNENLTRQNMGYTLWSQMNHCIFLKTQYRMQEEDYKEIVHRFRHGESRDSDEMYFKERQLSVTNRLDEGRLSTLPTDPTIIVQWNKVKHEINLAKAVQMSGETGRKLLFSVARDSCSNQTLNPRIIRDLLLLHDSTATKFLAGLLPLIVGMPVMFKHNLGTELGITNGTMGHIVKIQLDPRETVDWTTNSAHYLRYFPTAVYALLSDVGTDKDGNEMIYFQLPGLPPNVFPVTTSNTPLKTNKCRQYFKYKDQKISYDIIRTQLNLLPAWAITVNSSQGRSMDSAIIDLEGQYSSSTKPYVMISRLRFGSNMGVLGSWSEDLFRLSPDETMIAHTNDFLLPLEQRTLNNLARIVRQLKTFQRLLTN